MSDDLTPDDRSADDRFADEFGPRLRAVADAVDGGRVTRTGVASAVQEHRRRARRTRSAMVGVAAAVVLLGGIAVGLRGNDPAQQVSTAGSTTTVAPRCTVPTPEEDPAGWFRLSEAQAELLVEAGAIHPSVRENWRVQAALLTQEGLQLLADAAVEPYGKQMWDLGYEDAAGLELLRSEDLLSPAQEADIAAGVAPALDQAQADKIFAEFPDLDAIGAGGQPFPTSGVQYTPAPAPLDPAEVAASTPDCAEPGPSPTTSSLVARSGAPAGQAATTTSNRSAADSADGGQTWVVYLYVLSGRRNADGSITTALERMSEIMAGSEQDQRALVLDARAVVPSNALFEGDLASDVGAAEALGLDPELGQVGISVEFLNQADAAAFADQVMTSAVPLGPIPLTQTCPSRPDPV